MSRFIITGRLTNQELNVILRDSQLYRNEMFQAGIYNNGKSRIDTNIRNCLLAKIPVEVVPSTYNLAQSIILEHYSKHKVDISTVGELQYAEYGVGGKFIWHNDSIASNSEKMRGITMSIQLSNSEEYSGGSLRVDDHGNIRTLDRLIGSYIIFPAYTMHQVDVITQGLRKSLVVWIHLTRNEIECIRKNDI